MTGLATPRTPEEFARVHFGGAQLGDARLARRAMLVVACMARRPGASIPRLHDDPAAAKGAYRLFAHHAATPDALQGAHRRLVRQQASAPGTTCLLLEDTTTVDYSGGEPIEGLGPVGAGAPGAQGFHLHSVLAAIVPAGGLASEHARRAPLALLGLLHQEYHLRVPRPQGEPPSSSFHTRQRERESQLWERSTQALGPAPEGVRWIRVADRGADIHASLMAYVAQGHGFVVRACHDRALGGKKGRLFAAARSWEALGAERLALRARPGQGARQATLSLSAGRVVLPSPQVPGRSAGAGPALECTLVRAWEKDPPPGAKALEWLLLCDEPVTGLEGAREVLARYVARWVAEEFHKALKTGMGAERLQLESGERLFAAVALMSVVALRLVDLREHARLAPAAPARESGLDELRLRLLERQARRKLATVGEVALAVARLGGHMNRKGDGPPGWRTLWLGMAYLEAMVQGALLAGGTCG